MPANTTTGLATRIGSVCDSSAIGSPGGFCERGNAIAFDDVGINNPLGTLFWASGSSVGKLDPLTGIIPNPPGAMQLDFSPFGSLEGFRVVAMDFHPLTGDLYAAVQQGTEGGAPRSTLAILDPSVGTFTIIGGIDSTGVKLDGIAFVVPEPGTIVLMAIGLAGVGFSRRRKVQASLKPASAGFLLAGIWPCRQSAVGV